MAQLTGELTSIPLVLQDLEFTGYLIARDQYSKGPLYDVLGCGLTEYSGC